MTCDVDVVAHSVVEVCQRLYAQGLIAASAGNVSVRVGSDKVVITPSGLHKGYLLPSHMAVVTVRGEVLSGKPSSELPMHLAVYQNCESAHAVVHAHPPMATAWTIAEPELTELPCTAMSELILSIGCVPIVPYQTPGSDELGKALVPLLSKSKVCLLGRHGCLCWGASLNEAFCGAERLEHAAKTLCYAKMLGQLTCLPPTDVDQLKRMREKIGDQCCEGI